MNEVMLNSYLLLKRGTSLELNNNDSLIPKLGEPVFERDTFKLKIGDGETVYKNLPYIGLLTEIEGELGIVKGIYQNEKFYTSEGDLIVPNDEFLYIDINTLKIYHHKEEKYQELSAALQTTSELSADSTDDEVITAKGAYEYCNNIENEVTELEITLANETARAIEAEQKSLADAKAYTDKVKVDILGEGISETYDTLIEIQGWINEHGIEATDLASAIAAETANRTSEDNKLLSEINKLAEDYPPYVSGEIDKLRVELKDYFDTELGVIANGSY